MSYTDLRDFEAEAVFEPGDGIRIEIEKLGGGTPGEAYDGTWRYIVTNTHAHGAGEVMRGQDLETGMPITHAQAAAIVAGWLTAGESRSDHERAFGNAHEDTLSEFAYDMCEAA
ncbi:hypothetical protein [Actinomadura atramentaria]|uniref:hypothetical protein n=1 Tax=Actinomadura atramentaria TaxID=1990 RepID=UPI0003636D4B|nr:hypothetical protein [Actinomadura atramentaria]